MGVYTHPPTCFIPCKAVNLACNHTQLHSIKAIIARHAAVEQSLATLSFLPNLRTLWPHAWTLRFKDVQDVLKHTDLFPHLVLSLPRLLQSKHSPPLLVNVVSQYTYIHTYTHTHTMYVRMYIRTYIHTVYKYVDTCCMDSSDTRAIILRVVSSILLLYIETCTAEHTESHGPLTRKPTNSSVVAIGH